MAYVALYRSYRPTTFKEVIGQKHVVQTLKNAVMENKTSHAYIFSGLRGIGKTTIARILAKAVNCENQIDGEACNSCKNCLAIINDETTDIIELDAASNNGVDEMREILEKVNFLPSVLRKKVYIIDEAHMLSTAAFNALLKTLEEPPAYVMFILATTEPHKIPATILSRCQRFDFKQFTLEELKEEITYVCDKENILITKEAISAIAEAADGGMRDALSILDQANVFSENEITIDDVNSVTGRISNYKLIELVNTFKMRDATKSIYIINELVNMGKEVNRLVSGIIQFCRDVLLYKNVNDNASHKYIYDSQEFKDLANNVNTQELFYYIDVLVDVQNKIRFTNNQKIYLEVGIMKIINSASEDIDVLGKIQKLETLVSEKGGFENAEYGQDFDSKINVLDNKIKKISSELERAKFDEFKEMMESKMDMLEDVSSKNAALPTDLSYRLDSIEDKIRVLDNNSQVLGNNQDLTVVNEKLAILEEKLGSINNININNIDENNNYIALQEQFSNLKLKVENLENNQVMHVTSNNNEEIDNNNIEARIKTIEEYIELLVQGNSNKTNLDNVEIIKEIEELKENYFILVQNIKGSKIDDNMSDELGFDTGITTVDNKVDEKLERMVDELIANVNRISFKLQESESNINKINTEITSIKDKDNLQDENIDKALNEIKEVSLNNKNSIYDEKLLEIDEKISTLEKEDNFVKDELSKVKQLVQNDRRTTVATPAKEVVKPKEEMVAVKSKEEFVREQIPPRVVETNASKTLQTIKNVYDVRIIENILHEARERECREEKVRIINLWPKLEDKVGYAFAPVAKMLADGKLAANGFKEILIVYPSAIMCNHLMEPKNYNDAKQVLRITLGKDYDFIALPENTWQEKRNEYVGQFSIGIKRPKLTPINNPELRVVTVNYDQMNNTAKTASQIARDAFGINKVEKETE